MKHTDIINKQKKPLMILLISAFLQSYIAISQNITYNFNALGDLAYVQEDYNTAIKYYKKGEHYAKNEAILVYYFNTPFLA